MLDEFGQVIGMNTAVEMRPGNLGIAITIEHVMEEVNSTLANQDVEFTEAQVFLFNDPMNKRAHVKAALQKVVNWDDAKATEVMMEAHRTSRSRCGQFDKDEAQRLSAALSAEDLLSEVRPVAVVP